MGKKDTRELAAELLQNLTKKGIAFRISSPAFGDKTVCWITMEEDQMVLRYAREKHGAIRGSMPLAELLEALKFDFEAWKEKKSSAAGR